MLRGIKLVVLIIISILILGGGWYFYTQQNKVPKYEFVVASKSDIIQEVSITGRVNPVDMVNLGFSTNGTLEKLEVSVGDIVEEGNVLARLDDDVLQADLAQVLASLTSARAQLEQYKALVEREKASLADLEQGTRAEEITLQQVKVDNAKIALDLARNDVLSILEDSYTKADDAVRTKLDTIFSSPRSFSPSITFTTTNSALENSVESDRASIEAKLTSWRKSLDLLTGNENLITATSDAKIHLTAIRSLLDNSSQLVGGGLPSGSITQTVLDGYAVDISTGRANVSTAFSNVITKEVAFSNAEANIRVEENQLTLLEAGTTVELINAQKAAVSQAKANLATQEGAISEAQARVAKTRAQINKTVLSASIAGVITLIEPEVGESITANKEIISIISREQFQIEADIAETDIVQVGISQKAEVTLDAYGDDILFSVTVAKIDPAEKVIGGVPTYNVTFEFDEPDVRIRSGMTANIDIITASRENVIAIPQRAIIRTSSGRAVQVVRGDEIVVVPVTIGIRSSSGLIEIIEGLQIGERVVTFIGE